jgi:lipopolysaccharide transport system ATP-binding protein
MSEYIIKIKNLGKKYRIRHQQPERYTALRDVIANGVRGFGSSVIEKSRHLFSRTVASTPSPFIGQSSPHHLTPNAQHRQPPSEDFWALKNVSFEVKEGEVVGIIGRNGAGKSTLLKILSGITEPTEGRVQIKGRVASLLEVGTGFHPELSGRENIFVNGAILGMTRAEIAKRFDEIVAFAEVDKFLDTPVKRYSSGMYVRLAFAVAAHLEPEILLVDEVLAVGDAPFQKKCLTRMGEVGKQGRTVLFVSHNMGAIVQLCEKSVVLDNGTVRAFTNSNEATRLYLKSAQNRMGFDPTNFVGTLTPYLDFHTIAINEHKAGEAAIISPCSKINIKVTGVCKKHMDDFRTTFSVFKNGNRLLTLHDVGNPQPLPEGHFSSEVEVPAFTLRPGDYWIAIGGYRDGGREWIWGLDLLSFVVSEEWSPNYEQANIGIVNLPNNGRRCLSSKK